MANLSQKNNIVLSLVTFVCLIVVVCVVGIFTFNREKEETIQGQAEVNEYRISSKVPGRVLEIRVKEGQAVQAGDTLVILEAPEIEAKLSQAKAVHAAASAQNDKAKKGARKEEVQAAYEIWQKAKAGLDIAEKSYSRVNNLFNEGVLSEQKRDEAKAQFDAAGATEKAAYAQYTMAKNGAEKEVKEMAEAQVLQAEGVVAEVNSYVSETVLLATTDGEVSEVFPMIGELVGTGAPIMNIAVMNDMWITFNVREDQLKKMTMGSEVEGFVPALDKNIKLRINYIKDLGSYAAWKATKANGQYDLRTFEVRATSDNTVLNLRPGMSVLVKK